MLCSPTELDQQLQLLTAGQLSDPWENPSSILSAGNSQHFQLDNSKQPTNRTESQSASQPASQPASNAMLQLNTLSRLSLHLSQSPHSTPIGPMQQDTTNPSDLRGVTTPMLQPCSTSPTEYRPTASQRHAFLVPQVILQTDPILFQIVLELQSPGSFHVFSHRLTVEQEMTSFPRRTRDGTLTGSYAKTSIL